MDNFTHSLAGWALGQAGLKTRTRKGLAALILGANMPDVDVVLGWVPWEALAMHRGFTHGLVGGIVIMPPILAGLLWLLDRWQVSRGTMFKSGLTMHVGWLITLCYIGALTHPLLDLQTTYSVQLLSPFDFGWYHADSLFIIDVWIWTLLAGSIAWSRWRERRGREWRRPVQGAIAAALIYVAFNLGLSATATEVVRRHTGGSATSIFASPAPVWSWNRSMTWRQGNEIGRAEYFPFGVGLVPGNSIAADGMEDPIVRAAIAGNRDLRMFLAWSILPVATVERQRCSAKVTIGDARYFIGTSRRSRLSREIILPLQGSGC